MLTGSQCVIAAYLTDGDVICTECAEKQINFDVEERIADAIEAAEKELERDLYGSEERDIERRINEEYEQAVENAGLRPLIQYELDSDESWQEDGLFCGKCDAELVEPAENIEDGAEWGSEDDDILGDSDASENT